MFVYLRRFILKHKINLRLASTQHASKQTVKYTNTINLPKTKFPSRLSAAKRSELERSLVQGSFAGLYQYQHEHNSAPEFVLHDGPPYANGDLHMGHAVNKILKDITIRQHVVDGKKIHYKAGWDCHGLPIELKAMGGQSNLPPLEIRKKSRQFATDTSETQRKEFQSWGIMADWNNPKNLYKTFRPDYIQNELKIFLNFFEKGLVYRDLKPVFWSPSSGSALAEAELEYDSNFVSPSIMLRLKLAQIPEELRQFRNSLQDLYGIIWTTTPWTLPSNQAVCYNSSLEYSLIKLNNDDKSLYLIATKLIEQFLSLINQTAEVITSINGDQLNGTTYFHPIDKNSTLSFLPAEHVQDSKGTGLVHTAPAHGPDDFLVSLQHNIKIKCFVNEKGEYNDEAPPFLISKSALDEGNDLVIRHLRNDLLHSGQITHSYPIDWRTKKPVIIRASDQWFINTEKIKKKAIEEINKVNIYPRATSEANKRAMITQLEKRPYWCISRQRAWGVPIPVFYEKDTKRTIVNEKTIDSICALLHKTGNMDFWWKQNVENVIPADVLSSLGLSADQIEPGQDIFDIWFDSGTSWSYALDNDRVADLYLEGFDQFTGWFQSSLMTSIGYRNCAPYKSIFVHGFTVDEKGYKMSKSLGNVIHPSQIIQKYGVDVLRWWVASHGTQHSSIIVSHNLLQASADNLNKIRNTLKYLNGSIGQKIDHENRTMAKSYLDSYILNELWKFDKEALHLYNSYEYNRVASLIQNFIANQISSVYLNSVKDRLYCGNEEDVATVQNVLTKCYHILCKALWPIVPFIVEESWSYYDSEPFYKRKIQSQDEWKNLDAEKLIYAALELKQTFNQSTKDINTWTLDVSIECGDDTLDSLKVLHPKLEEKLNSSELCEILQVSSINLLPGKEKSVKLESKAIENVLCPRCRRFSISQDQNVCKRCDSVLLQKEHS